MHKPGISPAYGQGQICNVFLAAPCYLPWIDIRRWSPEKWGLLGQIVAALKDKDKLVPFKNSLRRRYFLTAMCKFRYLLIPGYQSLYCENKFNLTIRVSQIKKIYTMDTFCFVHNHQWKSVANRYSRHLIDHFTSYTFLLGIKHREANKTMAICFPIVVCGGSIYCGILTSHKRILWRHFHLLSRKCI